MNAPILWILLPLVLAGLLLLIGNQKLVYFLACFFTLFLAVAALLLPIDSALNVGGLTFKLAPSIQILGRNLTLTSADRSFLVFIYGSLFVWFIPSVSQNVTRLFIPLGLAITSLLVAALAVEPFLYAALIIEMAVLLSIPLLSTPGQKPAKGVIRFLIFQTLAMPFILFSGWLLAGIGANPGNLDQVNQAATFLGLGFAFLLAIFPFYTWIPLLAEEVHPFLVSFILWILPTVALFYALGFLDHYSWLRDAPNLRNILITTGALMVITGGILSAFQSHLGRMMGYATIVETGFSLLAISLGGRTGLVLFLMLLVPRALGLCLWALTLSIIKSNSPGLNLKDIKGLAHIWPLTSFGMVLAILSLAGMPLLAGFPSHQAILEGLATSSLPLVFWLLVGSLGLFISAVRVLAALTSATEGTLWGLRETVYQRILLAVGMVGLFFLGLFPQWGLLLWTKLPAIFEHLGQ